MMMILFLSIYPFSDMMCVMTVMTLLSICVCIDDETLFCYYSILPSVGIIKHYCLTVCV